MKPSRVHTDLRSGFSKRRGASAADPYSVPRGLHKEYPRMPRISLPEPEPLGKALDLVLRDRASRRTFSTDLTLSLGELGTLLGHSLRARKLKVSIEHGLPGDTVGRNYPSGGALYPVETYLVGKVFQEHPSGVFHYHPKAHVLEHLWELPSETALRNAIWAKPNPYPPEGNAFPPFLMVFTGVWHRSSAKYGDYSYGLGLLEAGHMSENVLLAAEALGLHACPLAGFNDELLIQLLDIDEREEQPIHVIIIGKK